MGAALALPTVGNAGALDVAGEVADGVAAGVLDVGAAVEPVEGAGVLLVVVSGTDDVVVGAVLRGRLLDEVAAGWGAPPPPAGTVDCVAVGCTFR